MSPMANFRAKAGTAGAKCGRDNARARACENARLVTGSGATKLWGPVTLGSEAALTTKRTTSSKWIQLIHCWPDPRGAPKPRR